MDPFRVPIKIYPSRMQIINFYFSEKCLITFDIFDKYKENLN